MRIDAIKGGVAVHELPISVLGEGDRVCFKTLSGSFYQLAVQAVVKTETTGQPHVFALLTRLSDHPILSTDDRYPGFDNDTLFEIMGTLWETNRINYTTYIDIDAPPSIKVYGSAMLRYANEIDRAITTSPVTAIVYQKSNQ